MPPAGAAAADQSTVERAASTLIEPLVREAISEKKLPGAVVLVGRGDRIVYQKAFGNRALVPAVEPMTLDTVFDLASLTKVVATTTSVMMLVEQGRIRLSDRVATYIPGFERYGKADITVRHLLTHVSGLRPDVDLADTWTGLRHGDRPGDRRGARFCARRAVRLQRHQLLPARRHRPPRERADRSISSRVSGSSSRSGMKDTTFTAAAVAAAADCADRELHAATAGRARARTCRCCAASCTIRPRGEWAGVAGHAGLFSTAADLAIFSRMLLGGGAYQGTRILARRWRFRR